MAVAVASADAVQHALAAVINADAAGELQLEQQSRLPGFLPLLAGMAVSRQCDAGTRQLAAVVLKQQIKRRWAADSKAFEPPLASEEERQLVMQALPVGLADPESKIRTAVGMCIAAIYKLDAGAWPGLLESLVGVVKAGGDAAMVAGAIRCLSLMSRDIDEQQLPQLAQALLPELHRLATVQHEQLPGLRAQALKILHDLVKGLEVMSGAQQRQARDVLTPLVEPWVGAMCAAVAQPLDGKDPSDWGVRMQCLRVLVQLVAMFGRPLQAHMPAVLAACWRMYTTALPVYLAHLVHQGDGGEGGELVVEVDGDGDTLDLETLLAQLFELLIALAGQPRFAKQVKPAVPEMLFTAVAYMQMTAEQQEAWLDDPNQYVADEEDAAFTVRVSGELLLDTLLQSFGRDALAAALAAVERRMSEAAQARAAGQPSWWKLREAALLALGGCGAAGDEEALQLLGGAHGAVLRGRVQALVDDVLQRDLQDPGPGSNPLLVGRALWVAARLRAVLRPNQWPALLTAAAQGLSSGLPAPVKIGACRALACLMPHVPLALLAPLSDSVYSGLLGLMAASSEDTLNLVLECMLPLVKADPAAARRNLPHVSTPVLEAWSAGVSDPILGSAAQDVLAALAATPHCLRPLAHQALPALAAVIQQPHGAQAGVLLEGCMDLLAVLVRPRQPEVVAAAARATLGPLLGLIATSDDAGAVQGASDLLCTLVLSAGPDILAWGAPDAHPTPLQPSAPGALPHPQPPGSASLEASASAVFQSLMAALQRLLDPSLDEHRCLFAGHLAYQLLVSLPGRCEPLAGQILAAVCRKLLACNMSVPVGGLVATISLLACRGGAGPLLDALAAMRLQPQGQADGGLVNGVEAVLPLMLERQGDVQGRFRIKQSAMALALMLQSGHPLLATTMTRGKRRDASSSGVRTRQQVAAGGSGEQWSYVPLAAKMAAVLAELMVDAPWEGADDEDDWVGSGAEEDGEWEEHDGSDDDQGWEAGGSGPGPGQGLASAGHGSARPSGDNAGGAVLPGPGGLGLTIAGIGISHEQASYLDASIAASPTLHAESSTAAGDDTQHVSDPLYALDLRSYLAACFLQLQAQQRELLDAASGLLPPRKVQLVAQAMAAAAAAAGQGGGAGAPR